MNPTPDHLDDETLSALLDGHAEADELDLAAHLGACDRCAARQTELAAARAALSGAPVEGLDEVARRRLVATALAASGRRRRWAQRHPALIGSAAAVVLAVLVGVPFVVGRGGSAQKNLSAAAPQAAQPATGPFLGDLGDLTDRDRLRLRLSGTATDAVSPNRTALPAEPGPSPAAGGTSSAAPVAAGAPAGGGLAGAPPSTTLGSRSSGGAGSLTGAPKSAAPADNAAESFAAQRPAGDRDRADADTCVTALLNGAARGGRLIGSGVGTWRNRPAVLAAFELSGGTVAFVADRSGCAVLDRFTF